MRYRGGVALVFWPNAQVSRGEVIAGDSAHVSIFDRGFLYGDGLFEVLRTSGGNPVNLAAHLDRLADSAAAIALPCPAKNDIAFGVGKVVAALLQTGAADARLRIIVTRGRGDIATPLADLPSPTWMVIAEPLRLPSAKLLMNGLRVQTSSRRLPPIDAIDPRLKSLAYLDRVLARAEASAGGFDEALRLTPSGAVGECTLANFFAVVDGKLVTAPVDCGVLPGITRAWVLANAVAAGVEISIRALSLGELARASEAFATSAVRGIVAIATIDDLSFRLTGPVPGPVTDAVARLFASYLDAIALGRIHIG